MAAPSESGRQRRSRWRRLAASLRGLGRLPRRRPFLYRFVPVMALLFGSAMLGPDCRVGMLYLRTDVPLDSWRLETHRWGDYAWNAKLLWEGRPEPGEWIRLPLSGRSKHLVRAIGLRNGQELFREDQATRIYGLGGNTWLRFDGSRLAIDHDRAPDGAPYDLRRWFSDGIYGYGPFMVGPVRIGDMLSCIGADRGAY